jgi:hypothetical protein
MTYLTCKKAKRSQVRTLSMRRRITSLILAGAGALLLGLSAPAAFATSGAHFFSASATVKTTAPNQGALLLNWDEAGVGQQQVNYTLAITSQSAVYACYNNGGNHPQASNKEGPTGPAITNLGTFSPINGRVTVNNFLVPGTPLPNAGLTCPSGQTLRIVQVTYFLGSLTDTTNNVSIALNSPGCVSFDTKNFPC